MHNRQFVAMHVSGIILGLVLAAFGLLPAAVAFPLALTATIPLPGSNPINGPKLDHHAYRETPPTVFVSMRQNNTVVVIDANAQALAAVLPFATPKGIWAIENLGLLVVSASGEASGTVRAVALDPPYSAVWSTSVAGCDVRNDGCRCTAS